MVLLLSTDDNVYRSQVQCTAVSNDSAQWLLETGKVKIWRLRSDLTTVYRLCVVYVRDLSDRASVLSYVALVVLLSCTIGFGFYAVPCC